MTGDRRTRVWLIAIVAVAFVARLAWLLYAKGDAPRDFVQAGDQFSYWYYGNEIAAGHGYVEFVTHHATAYYPIGYPAALAVLFWAANHLHLGSHLILVAGLMHVVISTATVGLVFMIGRRVFNPTVGLVAAGLMAIFPNAIYQVSSLQLETMFVFLATAAVAVIVDHDWSGGLPSRARLLVFGVVLGASVLVRPFSIWFLLGLFLAAYTVARSWRRAFLVTLVPAVVVVGMSVPWIIRNEIRLHAFIPSSTNTGDTLCIDRNSTAEGGFRFADHDGCVDPALPEVERNSGNTRKAIDFVTHHPGREALEIVRRGRIEFESDHDGLAATAAIGGGPSPGSHRFDFFASIADWYFYVVGILALAGLAVLFTRGRTPERRIVFVAFASLFVIPLLLWGNPRFHFPFVPYIALFAGAALGEIGSRVRRPGVAAQP